MGLAGGAARSAGVLRLRESIAGARRNHPGSPERGAGAGRGRGRDGRGSRLHAGAGASLEEARDARDAQARRCGGAAPRASGTTEDAREDRGVSQQRTDVGRGAAAQRPVQRDSRRPHVQRGGAACPLREDGQPPQRTAVAAARPEVRGRARSPRRGRGARRLRTAGSRQQRSAGSGTRRPASARAAAHPEPVPAAGRPTGPGARGKLVRGRARGAPPERPACLRGGADEGGRGSAR